MLTDKARNRLVALIKGALKDVGSQHKLAKKLNVSQGTIYKILNTNTTPGLETIEKVCTGLSVPISSLYDAIHGHQELHFRRRRPTIDEASSPTPFLCWREDKGYFLAYFDFLGKEWLDATYKPLLVEPSLWSILQKTPTER